VERITDAFTWPARDHGWLTKVLIIGIAGAINGVGWMLATLDRLRAGEEELAPANLTYIGRGLRLFVVNLAYGLAVVLIAAAIYLPALLIASSQSQGPANPALVSLAVLLSLLAFSAATLGSLALNFALPAIVLATDREGVAGGLSVSGVLRLSRINVGNTLIAGLMLIAAGFVGSLGIVLCGIGVLFTSAYALAMQAWIIHSFELGTAAAKAA